MLVYHAATDQHQEQLGEVAVGMAGYTGQTMNIVIRPPDKRLATKVVARDEHEAAACETETVTSCANVAGRC
jgi:hypothetical protein